MSERAIFEAFLFAIAGLGLEVLETALLDYPTAKDNLLMGHASAWYLPFYAVVPLWYFERLHATLFALPFYARAAIYPLSFWTVEFAAMWLLRALLGKSPSEDSYRRSKWHVRGLIRLDLAPVWMCFGFVFEWMFRGLRGL